MRIVEGLWGGELPEFESLEELNELIQALVNGLWNDLTRHQKRSQPFRLTRLPSEPTAANLGHYGRVRLDELGRFIQGLFNGEEALDLPERAHLAIGQPFELRALIALIFGLAGGAPVGRAS